MPARKVKLIGGPADERIATVRDGQDAIRIPVVRSVKLDSPPRTIHPDDRPPPEYDLAIYEPSPDSDSEYLYVETRTTR